jgi:hypothetical protein
LFKVLELQVQNSRNLYHVVNHGAKNWVFGYDPARDWAILSVKKVHWVSLINLKG